MSTSRISVGAIARRAFLKGSAALAVARAAAFAAPTNQAASAKGRILAYVGTYSSPQGPEGSGGNGKGIYLFEMNPRTGALAMRGLYSDSSNPSWLAFDPSRTHLYAANEIANFDDTHAGSVSAFSIDRSTGDLKLLNTVSSRGAGPAHLSVHPSGKFVLVANYGGRTVAVLPILANGELGPATDVQENKGAPGPAHATSAPLGSFAISGHEQSHPHMIQSDPSGRFVLVSDLGLDQIFIWKFDQEKGKLLLHQPASAPLPAGDGPRHFAFHPNGRWLYSLQEESSTLLRFDYDAGNGKLTAGETVSTLPKGFAGTNFTSEVMVSPDGKFVYAANRLHDSIAWFSIDEKGRPTLVDEEWTRGDYPRSFNIDPTGNFLYSCNQRGDAITAFRISHQTGSLTFTGHYTPVGTPAIIVFFT
ncbi:MAG TPA: lactonase family protein [Terriglobia bacterium]|jgi:6-phosphogluconolactonase (cycloisomerase 2 family)|nr:lactonase family protein [Terriglobia bacterium]